MRDVETGSWWQQISGESIQGSLKGQKLKAVDSDELSFGVWKRENPNGRVLRPDEKILGENKYESANWEDQVSKMPVRVNAKIDDRFEPRELIIGIKVGTQAKAYPFSAVEKQSPIIDSVGGTELVILLAGDGKSVRAFDRTVNGKVIELLQKPGTNELIDAETGSVWDFTGTAIRGELSGKRLTKIQLIKDYWFDWKTYNPDTAVYRLGSR